MKKALAIVGMIGLCVFAFCSNGATSGRTPDASAEAAGSSGMTAAAGGASPQAKDMGIGPVKSVELGPVDKAMAEKGKGLFDDKCSMCHGLTEAKTGPALGNILSQVTPEYVMNLLLNTSEMEQKNARIIGLIKKYGMPMPSPGLDQDQARAILEYLRTTK